MAHDSEHHDEIHMPPPSPAPIIVSAGATFLLIGLVNRTFLVLGLIVLAVGIGIWALGPN